MIATYNHQEVYPTLISLMRYEFAIYRNDEAFIEDGLVALFAGARLFPDDATILHHRE